MKINNTLIRPLTTEKSVNQAASNVYTFQVNKMATKHSIMENIKKIYSVDVLSVRTLIMPGKQVRKGRTNRYTKTQSWKKALVQIKEGQKIDIYPEVKE